MKKYFYMAVAAVAVLSSCTSENASEEMKSDGKVEVFTATIEGETRTTIEAGSDESKKKVCWSLGDEISVNGVLYQTTSTESTAEFTKNDTKATPTTTPYKAYYPASMYDAETVTLPASYTYAEGKFNMPMYAKSSTTELSFKNLCGILAITVPNTQVTSVSKIEVCSDNQLNGELSDITDAGVITFASATLTDANKKITLSFTNAKSIASSETFYVPVPAGTHKLSIVVCDGTNSTVMNTKSSVTIERSGYYPIDFSDTNLLPGKFTVHESGKQVMFTKGNLYWDGFEYKFEAKQYDYPETWDVNHVGHFFWTNATDFQVSGREPYASKYNYGSRTTYDDFFCGIENKMIVEGTSDLYALTIQQLHYIIFSRTNYSNLYKFPVTVAGKGSCLIIAPDGYTGTLETSYTAEAWITAESSGLVCLPAAGYREGSEIKSKNVLGHYWTSTPWIVSQSDANAYAQYYNFNTNDGQPHINEHNTNPRYYGYALRLVK